MTVLPKVGLPGVLAYASGSCSNAMRFVAGVDLQRGDPDAHLTRAGLGEAVPIDERDLP